MLSNLRKSQADQELAKAWSPPTISDKQRKLLEEMEEVSVYIHANVVKYKKL